MLRDPRLELFAREYALALARGVKRSEAAASAALAAGYPKGSSFASNARRRAQRSDVKKRVLELTAPALEKAKVEIDATIEWATAKLASIANYDLGEEAVRVPDQIAAIRALADMHGWIAPKRHDLMLRRAADQMTDDELARIAAGSSESDPATPRTAP